MAKTVDHFEWWSARALMPRTLALILLAAQSWQLVKAQSILDVVPDVVTSGQEARFMASGKSLPASDSAKAVLRLSTVPLGACTGARRYQEATVEKYYFACTPKPGLSSFVVQIFAREGRRSTLLWSKEVAVMGADAGVSNVQITGQRPSFDTLRVLCDEAGACLTLAGDILSAGSLQVMAQGASLPRTWLAESPACTARKVPDSETQLRVTLQCEQPAPGDGRTMKIWSAAPARGGKVVWEGVASNFGGPLPGTKPP